MSELITEMRNEESENLHEYSTMEILQLMNDQDKKIPFAVEKALPQIKKAVDQLVYIIENGGNVFYFGAGTSGRLGVLDASECPPTFGVSPELFQGIIAGGDTALRNAVENAEDDWKMGKEDIDKNVSEKDIVVGIASSGTTPYVLGAIRRAKEKNIPTVGISCNQNSELSRMVDIPIEVLVGPEVITGSTRLKAGTAQKMVLNMLSTAAMIRTGKVYKNYMINLQATNKKLKRRAIRIIKEVTGVDEKLAEEANKLANGNVKIAILILMFNLTVEEAEKKIKKHQGNFIKALYELKGSK